jgi:hypothetical protein
VLKETEIPSLFIISGTDVELWSESNFGLIGHDNLPCICIIPSAPAIILNVSQKACSVRVFNQHHLRFCFDHLNCVIMAVLSIGQRDKISRRASQASWMGGGLQLSCI